ncbi:hypothetical protein ABPG75_001304 [Micractinium tetrahymenae]
MALPQRLASLTLEGRPSFAESLAAAVALQEQRQPALDQQLAACRALVRSLPSALPTGAAAQLVTLASSWLADDCGSGSSDSSNSQAPSAAAQLQAEAAHLYLALFNGPKVKLQSGACRQLLQQLCRLCWGSPTALAAPTPQQQHQQASSLVAAELACACFDLLAQLPHWYPQPPRAEVAAAVAAVAAALERQVQGARPGSAGGALPEASHTTRLLSKLLRALQVLLAEAKKDHGANAGSLALLLQRLLTYGWQQRGGSIGGSGSTTPKRGGGSLAAAPLPVGAPSTAAAAAAAGASPIRAALPAATQTSTAAPPPSPGKYRPPHARASSAQEEPTAGSAAPSRRSTMGDAVHAPLESSDSESSDAEGGGGGGERHHAGRVRSAALACLQLLAKADPKSLHGSWTALLPVSDAVAPHRGAWGGPSLRTAGSNTSIAHLLLHDLQLRVRHAAAATLTTLLEGPAQRAYLAVAEARDLERQPVRGFTTLSASLGQMLVCLHQALLHSIQQEQDPMVLAAALRALGTLLLGAPYHRLPPALLPLCVRALAGCLARATPPGGAAALPPEQLPVASACLACLAAAFSSKGAAAALSQQLVDGADSTAAGANGGAEAGNHGGSSSAGPHQRLLQLLFGYAACQHPGLQLEALLALRGVAQQHCALLAGCWERLLAVGRAGAALPAPAVPQSPRPQQGAADGTLPEKVAQQSVRLPGDFLQASEEGQLEGAESAEAAGICSSAAPAAAPTAALTAAPPAAAAQHLAAQWQQVAEQVLAPAVQHSSPLLRAAAQAVISGLSPAAFAALPQPLQRQLLGWCCAAVAADEASPVRAAAAKALGAVAAAPALCMLAHGPAEVLSALSASCHDSVLAVRIPAAAALASLCHMLSQTATVPSDIDPSSCSPAAAAARAMALAAGVAALPACLRLAVTAAGDSDKMRPSSLQAVGSLFQLRAQLAVAPDQAAVLAAPEVQPLLAAAAQAVQLCTAASSTRVQWAACEAAGALLACPPPEAQPHWAPLLGQLLALLRSSPNFRSRALAAAALRQLGGRAALPADSLSELLESVAAVLIEGKASGFTAVPAAPPAGQAQQAQGEHQQDRQQQQQPPEPADVGSKAQLEAALVAAVLHLLSLVPAALEGSAALQARRSSHAAQLRRLVRQAREELLQPEEAGQGLASVASGFEAGLFDLSQASAPLAAAAAAGLALLQ